MRWIDSSGSGRFDAFVVRATLVPALMQLAGRANWWAPAWARRVHDRVGLKESAPVRAGEATPADAAVPVRADEATYLAPRG